MPWRQIVRFSAIYYALMLIAVFVLTLFSVGSGPHEVPYSEFLQALEGQRVAEVRVSDRSVVWTTHDQPEPLIKHAFAGDR